MAATNAFVIRFPDGAYEYRTTLGAMPALGEKLTIKGEVWSVTQIRRDGVVSVNVERVDRKDEEE